MHVSALTAADAERYRTLMLQAYEQAADAFVSTADERRAEPLSWWIERIGAPSRLAESFGAFEGRRLVGTVAIEYSAKPKTRHSAQLIGMYVQPEARGRGAGAMLMHAAIAAARERPGVLVLRLTVTEGNAPAIRLYESVGFVGWGVEPLAIRTPAGLAGKLHMVLRLGDERAMASPPPGPLGGIA